MWYALTYKVNIIGGLFKFELLNLFYQLGQRIDYGTINTLG